MRLTIEQEPLEGCDLRYRIQCGEDAVGTLAWNGRGSFSIDVFGRSCGLHQPDALERARQLGRGMRMLLATGSLPGIISTRREKDGLLGSCTFYELESGGLSVCGYPNPGGGRGWRMSIHRDGKQIALAKRPSEPVHTPDGLTIVVLDEDAAVCALLLACYDVYASYLENDGGAAGPFSFRFVNIFGKRAAELDDPGFEECCEGGSSEEDAAEEAVAETAADRAARLAAGFAVKGDIIDRRS